RRALRRLVRVARRLRGWRRSRAQSRRGRANLDADRNLVSGLARPGAARVSTRRIALLFGSVLDPTREPVRRYAGPGCPRREDTPAPLRAPPRPPPGERDRASHQA